MKEKLKVTFEGLATVFRRPAFVFVAIGVSFLAFLTAIWLANLELLKFVLFSEQFSIASKFKVIIASFGGIVTNFHTTSMIVTLLVIALFGINVAMVSYYLKCKVALDRSAGAGLAGTVFGMMGVGCASCGSVLITTFFGAAFTASVVGVLPLRGLEFGLAGVLLLVTSIYFTSKKIAHPEVCRI